MEIATLPLPIIWQALYETLARQPQDEPLSIRVSLRKWDAATNAMLTFTICSVIGATDWTYLSIFIEDDFRSGTVAFGHNDTMFRVDFLANIIRLVGGFELESISLGPLIRCFIKRIEKRRKGDGRNQAFSDHAVDNSAT